MEAHKAAILGNDFSWVSTLTPTVPESIRQEYRDEMEAIIEELNTLLPRLRIKVNVDIYAVARRETMLMTISVHDDSLDIYTLESLLQNLKWHRRTFMTALSEPTKSV